MHPLIEGVTVALSSEAAAERAMEKWEVGPKEDVVQALIETLVDPRLPISVSVNDPPSKDAQKSVARQMHAVVLLYNYYHRKQNSELEFLDFVSFCKLALLLRPSLISFMKVMHERESKELNGAEDQLSVTEKAIKDACDIAMALDASKDIPITEGWPISKVAVLLIDPKKENCLLQFGAVTEGVWSLIEKELNESNINKEILAEEKVGNKRKRNSQKASTDDRKLLQLGYDAVKDITAGIDSSDLVVLETEVTYSLSKARSAAQFYMMQCSQSFSVNQSVPLKFLVDSLQGPLAEKDDESWRTTPLVEYHHMLPYVEFISCWLFGKDLSLPSLNGYNASSTTNSGEKESTQSRILAVPFSEHNGKDSDDIDNNSFKTNVNSSEEIANENSEINQKESKHSSGGKVAGSIFRRTARDVNVTDKFNKRCDILDSAKKDTSRISLENLRNDSDKHEKGSLSGPSRGLSQRTVKDDNIMAKFNKRCDFVDSAKKEGSRINLGISDTDSDDHHRGVVSTGLSPKTPTDENVSEKFNKRSDVADSATKEESRIYLDDNSDECLKGSSSSPSSQLQRMSMSNITKICTESEDSSKKLNSKIRVYHHRRKNISSAHHDAHNPEHGVTLKVEMANTLKSNNTRCRDEKVPEDNGDVTISCNQNGVSVTENPLVQFEACATYNVEAQKELDSEDLQNALALLYRKRQELCSQICTMEDTLAFYEESIERIRDGGEVGLARQCIKSIVSGNHHLLLKNETQIQDKDHQPGEDHCNSQFEKQSILSDTFLPGKSSCQDLEYICHKNNWRQPRYFIEPSDGKLQSNVVVVSKDLKLSSKGDLKSNPYEARESAAAQMIVKIQKACM